MEKHRIISQMVLQIAVVFILTQSVSSRDVTREEKAFIDVYNEVNKDIKPQLGLDEAWMTLNNNLTFDLDLFVQNHECYLCEMLYFDTIKISTTKTIVANATFGTDIELRRKDSDQILCRVSTKFLEHGDYWLFLGQESNGTKSCDIVIANDPMNSELPILYVVIGLFVLGVLIKIIAVIYRKFKSPKAKVELTKYGADTNGGAEMSTLPTPGVDSNEKITTHSKRQRLKSLDTFRGLSLMLMIFVNFGGGGYWFFEHPPWNGITVADLVFPWFVFIMGTSMNYSFRSMLKRGKSRPWILWKVIRRAALLFAFGIILNTNWGPVDLEKLRIPGVLQRLGLSYLIIALMETVFARGKDKFQEKSWSWLRDVVVLLPEWILSLGILAAYLALTFALPVPGCPTGYIGPGGLHDGKKYENCTGGAAGYIDRLVLGDNHIYGNPTPKKIYQTVVPYDPGGILGTLSSIFLCFLGLQAGRIFISYTELKDRIARLLFWAIILGAIGAGLCECSQNEGVIPLNKNLWSVSFILVTASFGYILLCVLYVLIDVLRIWGGEPFIFPGMNPLVVYICHSVFYRFFPVNWQIDHVHWKLLLKAVWDTAIFTILAFYMYCKKVFIAL